MSEYGLHSIILAADCRVDDIEETWALLEEPESCLANSEAVVHPFMWPPHRDVMTDGERATSVADLLRAPVAFELFDIARIGEIPGLFAGEVVEKFDLCEPSRDRVKVFVRRFAHLMAVEAQVQ
jgi:hypothetical protein